MKKKILFIVMLLFILCGCKKHNTKDENETIKIDNYNIAFTYNYNQYDIETKDNKIYVSKNTIVQCVKAPCNPIKDKEYSIELTDEYKKFIEDLFKDKDTKSITIYKNMLDNNQLKVLSSIIGEEIKNNDIVYKINKTEEYNSKYKEKGYYINKISEDKILITIALGTKNTGGYSIYVESINTTNNNDTTIYVKETSPNPGDVVTQAFTYPTVEVELNKMPNSINVVNNTTHETYLKKSN